MIYFVAKRIPAHRPSNWLAVCAAVFADFGD
jgi:hypothetical protein